MSAKLKIVCLADLPMPTPRTLIAGQLEAAARILRGPDWQDRLDSVSWRVADCGLDLRRLIEREWPGVTDIPGVDVATGLGALLPLSRKDKQ
jgi:hypothetical protein